jgi:hypothetical protein
MSQNARVVIQQLSKNVPPETTQPIAILKHGDSALGGLISRLERRHLHVRNGSGHEGPASRPDPLIMACATHDRSQRAAEKHTRPRAIAQPTPAGSGRRVEEAVVRRRRPGFGGMAGAEVESGDIEEVAENRARGPSLGGTGGQAVRLCLVPSLRWRASRSMSMSPAGVMTG